MGDDRKPEYDAKYEMAPQSEADPEKGEVKIVDGTGDEKKSTDGNNEWGGLNKAELLEVADTPFWNWTRNILLVLFWVGWIAMLVAAIVIVSKVPRCPEVQWWEKSVFYRVLPQSFKDSNGDGYGDLNGLTNKLDYVKTIGADVIVLSSIYQQREDSVDLGQEIVNFTNVDPSLGTLNHFDNFMKAAKEKELKVILEFIPNHSSDQHPWFLASRNSSGNYSDFYTWQECGDGSSPPNDLLNKNGDSAWTYDAVRGACYYHYLESTQPDLNYDSIHVQMAIEEVLKFWFEREIDGFLFSGVDYIFESGEVASALGNRRRRQAGDVPIPQPSNETASTVPASGAPSSAAPSSGAPSSPEPSSEPETTPEPEPSSSSGSGSATPPQYSCVGEECSSIQKKLHDLLVSWRDIFNKNSYLGKYRVLITETEQPAEVAVMQLGNMSREADLVLNLGFAKSIEGAPTADSIQMAVSQWLSAKMELFESRWNMWALGDEDMSRIASRAGEKFARALNFILLTLPGTPITYYGEELATQDLAQVSEPSDAYRGPMFWSNATDSFSNGTAYLPLPTDQMYSVKDQDGDQTSSLSVYKKLAMLHSEPSMTAGKYSLIFQSESLYAYLRQFPSWPGYLVITNFGSSTAKVDFEVKNGEDVIKKGVYKLCSTGVMPEKTEVILADLEIESGTSLLIEV